MPDKDIVTIFLVTIMKYSICGTAYKQCPKLPANQRTWVQAEVWWKVKVRIKKPTATSADAHRCIMGAAGDEGIQEFNNSINNSSAVHANTQGTINNLTGQVSAQLPTIQQQLSAMQQMMMTNQQQINAVAQQKQNF